MTQLFTVSPSSLCESLAARQCRKSSIAIGNFDGLHRGHLALLHTMPYKHLPRPWVVMTFEPHPRQFFSPQTLPFRLSNSAQKRRWLAEHGVDALLVVTFEQSFAALSARDFVETFLVQGLEMQHIVVGENFAFGHKRQGTLATLRAFESSSAFRVHAVPLCGNRGTLYASSRARDFVREGKLDEARAILGRSFEIEGVVQQGKGLGSRLGFPTANIELGDYCQPRFGVYDVSVFRGQQRLNAVASFGKRPTLEEGLSPLLELHFFDSSDNLYGETLRVGFERFQRPEQRYESLSALQAQIAKDVALSKAYFAARSSTQTSYSSDSPVSASASCKAQEGKRREPASQSL